MQTGDEAHAMDPTRKKVVWGRSRAAFRIAFNQIAFNVHPLMKDGNESEPLGCASPERAI